MTKEYWTELDDRVKRVPDKVFSSMYLNMAIIIGALIVCTLVKEYIRITISGTRLHGMMLVADIVYCLVYIISLIMIIIKLTEIIKIINEPKINEPYDHLINNK